jgi:poly(3-hydroxybutyrate) depolymerase
MSNIKRFALVITILIVLAAGFFAVPNRASAATVCSPATAISVPYAKDSTGDICVAASSLCTYINSWNLTTLEVNGTSYLNTYVAASSIAPLNGSYTIHYVSSVAWGHFEIAGTCGVSPTATTGPTVTRTSTPTTGPSLTPSNTPTTGPSLTPTRTNTPGSPTVTPVSGSTTSINAGGSATGSFTADQYFSGGTTVTNTATIDMSQITSNPPPAAIFNSERYGALTYTIPNRSGAQTVTLYFAETYATAAGQRLFNVTINGTTVLSSFDIYASAGGQNRAIARSFNTTANSSGQVVIQFTTGTENPKINGITVTGGSVVGPTPTATAGSGNRSAGCNTTPGISSSQYNNGSTIAITAAGMNRRYILNVPTNYNNTTPYKLIIAYHELNGNDKEMYANGYYHLLNLSNNSTIFVAPNGQKNGGACTSTGNGDSGCGWPNTNNSDLQLADAVVAQITQNFCVNMDQIMVTGWSYGGSMSYKTACERPKGGTASWYVRGAAVYSGAQLSGNCTPTKPVAYYASHGTGDTVLGYDLGLGLFQNFASANMCTYQTPTRVTSGNHVCTTLPACMTGYPTTFCSFNGGHTPDPSDGGASWEYQNVWNFFMQLLP